MYQRFLFQKNMRKEIIRLLIFILWHFCTDYKTYSSWNGKKKSLRTTKSDYLFGLRIIRHLLSVSSVLLAKFGNKCAKNFVANIDHQATDWLISLQLDEALLIVKRVILFLQTHSSLLRVYWWCWAHCDTAVVFIFLSFYWITWKAAKWVTTIIVASN